MKKAFLGLSIIVLLVTILGSLVLVGCSKSATITATTTATTATTTATTATTTATKTTTTTATTPVKPIVLKWGTRNTINDESNGLVGKGTAAFFMDQIEARSNKLITFGRYGDGVLIKTATEGLDAVRTGVADITNVDYSGGESRIPLQGAFSLPLTFASPQAAHDAAFATRSMWLPQVEALGVKVFLLHTSPFVQIYSTKPIKTLEDLKGLKMSAAGGNFTKMTSALGAIPVSIGTNERYEGLQKGIIDACVTTGSFALSNHLDEVTKYYVEANLYGSVVCIIISNQAWNSIPKDLQDLMMKVAGEAEEYSVKNAQRIIAEGKAYAEGKKMVTYVLPPAEMARWIDKAKNDVRADWLKITGDEGAKILAKIDSMNAALAK